MNSDRAITAANAPTISVYQGVVQAEEVGEPHHDHAPEKQHYPQEGCANFRESNLYALGWIAA